MPDLSVTLIQAALHWEDVDANLQMFDQKIDSIQERTELVILPEMFSTGFSMHPEKLAEGMDGKTVQWMKKKAKEKNIIITGSIIIAEGSDYFNRLLWILPNGQAGYYDKRHLFSYAREDKHYTPGNKKLIARVKGWKVSLIICYDLRFPVWIRQAPEPADRFDLLICVACWPAGRAPAWNTLLPARAIENQCYVAGVNCTGTDGNHISYAGDSCIIDPQGHVRAKKDTGESILTCVLQKEEIDKVRGRFPFLDDADRFKLL